MELIKVDGVFGIVGKFNRIAFIANRYWLNGIEVTLSQLPIEAQNIINNLKPSCSATQSFNQAWRLLLSEAEASGNYSQPLLKSLKFRLTEITRCLTINSSELVFH